MYFNKLIIIGMLLITSSLVLADSEKEEKLLACSKKVIDFGVILSASMKCGYQLNNKDPNDIYSIDEKYHSGKECNGVFGTDNSPAAQGFIFFKKSVTDNGLDATCKLVKETYPDAFK